MDQIFDRRPLWLGPLQVAVNVYSKRVMEEVSFLHTIVILGVPVLARSAKVFVLGWGLSK